jgi:hypothetical protein
MPLITSRKKVQKALSVTENELSQKRGDIYALSEHVDVLETSVIALKCLESLIYGHERLVAFLNLNPDAVVHLPRTLYDYPIENKMCDDYLRIIRFLNGELK